MYLHFKYVACCAYILIAYPTNAYIRQQSWGVTKSTHQNLKPFGFTKGLADLSITNAAQHNEQSPKNFEPNFGQWLQGAWLGLMLVTAPALSTCMLYPEQVQAAMLTSSAQIARTSSAVRPGLEPTTTSLLLADEAGMLTEEQRIVAEAWRKIDKLYAERTFNGQDWFAVRQKYVRKAKYKSTQEAYTAITEILKSLGDPYTRFLPPEKYRSLVDSVTGEVAGIGVELFLDKEVTPPQSELPEARASGSGTEAGASGSASANGGNGNAAVRLASLEPNSPAERSGLKPGDILLSVDGSPVTGLIVDDVAGKIRGSPGTEVILKILRPKPSSSLSSSGSDTTATTVVTTATGPTEEIRIRREVFQIRGVKAFDEPISSAVPGYSGPMKGNLRVVKIRSFSQTTAPDVEFELTGVKPLVDGEDTPRDRDRDGGSGGGGSGSGRKVLSIEDPKAKVDLLVLDMRGNSGGLLPAAIDAARLLLPANKDIVFVSSKTASLFAQYSTGKAYGIAADVPLIIVVNEKTASAAEVLTAALKDNNRGYVVGGNKSEKTFGKGVIQTIEPLSDGSGIAVTIARYETPTHKNINTVGIYVDEVNGVCKPSDPATACLSPASVQKASELAKSAALVK